MLGLLLEGGSMRAGFAAGAVMALMDKNLNDFDAAVAVSASVPTLAYFAAGQREEIERVWREELCTPRLVCYRNIPAACLALSGKRSILDIGYLVYDVMKARYPIDTSAILANKMDCRFAVAKDPEGKLDFLGPDSGSIYRIFLAAMAIPGCYPESVRVNGCAYLDGGAVNPIPLCGLLDERIERVVAILTRPLSCGGDPPGLLERALFRRYFQRHPWMLQSLREAAKAYNEQVSLLAELAREKPARAFIICPEKMPPAKFITRDKKKINKTIDLGYQQVERLERQIRRFLR